MLLDTELGMGILGFQVAGELRLACGWRVTPFDVAAMRLRGALQEAEHKEEVAAALLERQWGSAGSGNPEHDNPYYQPLNAGSSADRRGATSGTAAVGSHGRVAADGGARAASLPVTRGRLDVNVRAQACDAYMP